MNWLEFCAAIAWPAVAIIGILILTLSKALPRSIGELSINLFSIKSSVDEFKKISEEFNDRQRTMNESLQWLKDSGSELSRLSTALDSVRAEVADFLLGQGGKDIAESSGESSAEIRDDLIDERSPQQRYESIYQKWGQLTELIRQRVGPQNYDGRAIGSMAWKLSHGLRTKPISKQDAELIESLHSQFKRFGRMSATRDEWLTADLYENFMRGVDQAIRSVDAIS